MTADRSADPLPDMTKDPLPDMTTDQSLDLTEDRSHDDDGIPDRSFDVVTSAVRAPERQNT